MVKLSIVIPNYNHGRYLIERMESILNQTYQDFEIIILDDFSIDESSSILNNYKDHPKVSHYIFNKVNSGSVFKQWNKGIELAKGELIWVAESDDISSIYLLEKLIHIFDKNEKISLAYCQSHKINSNGEIYGDWLDHTKLNGVNCHENDFVMNGREFIVNYMVNQNSIPNASAVIFKKDVYQAVGGPMIELKTIGDWNIWVKILALGDVYFCSEKLNFFRKHDSSCVAISKKNDKRASVLLMYIKMFEDFSNYFYKIDMKIHKTMKKTMNKMVVKFLFNCLSSGNFKLLLKEFIKYKIFLVIFSINFYEILLNALITEDKSKKNNLK